MIRRLAIAALLLAAAFTPAAANAAISPDTGYGTGGVAKVPAGCAAGTTNSIAAAPGYNGGLYLLAECAHGYDRLTALTDAGTVDPTFGTGGHLTIKFPTSCWGTSVHLKPIDNGGSGQLFIASEGETFGSTQAMHVCIVKVTTTGKLWPGFGGSTPIRHLDRVGGGQNQLLGIDSGFSARLSVYTERVNDDWHKSAAFVNVYASNGHPDPRFSGDGQRAFVQPYAGQVQWGGSLQLAITVDDGRDLDGIQLVAFNYNGTLNRSYAGDGTRFVSRSVLGNAFTAPGGFVVDHHGGIVFTTHFFGPGKQWVDLDRVGVTGKVDVGFDAVTQKISALSDSKLGEPDLQQSEDHFAVGWNADGLVHTTGYNADGTRWGALGPNGTANVLAELWAPDRAAYYDLTNEGGPQSVIDISRFDVG